MSQNNSKMSSRLFIVQKMIKTEEKLKRQHILISLTSLKDVKVLRMTYNKINTRFIVDRDVRVQLSNYGTDVHQEVVTIEDIMTFCTGISKIPAEGFMLDLQSWPR